MPVTSVFLSLGKTSPRVDAAGGIAAEAPATSTLVGPFKKPPLQSGGSGGKVAGAGAGGTTLAGLRDGDRKVGRHERLANPRAWPGDQDPVVGTF